jgi:hypothetical protein
LKKSSRAHFPLDAGPAMRRRPRICRPAAVAFCLSGLISFSQCFIGPSMGRAHDDIGLFFFSSGVFTSRKIDEKLL